MNEVRVNVYIHAPRERVFEALSNHESLLRLEGLLGKVSTQIVQAGSRDRNGLGCRREVRGGLGMHFIEEISAWEPPSFYEYRILETSMPLRHRSGRIELTARGEGTEVDWTSCFEMTVPFAKGLVGVVSEGFASVLFTTFLLAEKARIEGKRAA